MRPRSDDRLYFGPICWLAPLMGALLLAAGPGLALAAPPAAPVRSSALVPLPFFVRDAGGGLIDPASTDPATPLYEPRALQPVVAPDGHHVTWGLFASVEGRISVKCVRGGTHVVLHVSNLIPHGVYTTWNVTFGPSGFTGEFDSSGNPVNLIGVGPGGPNDGSRSEFTASATGRASISTITPAGELGTLGSIGGCALTDEFEWHVVGLYHIDGQSHGTSLGPDGTMAEQFAFVFRRDQ